MNYNEWEAEFKEKYPESDMCSSFVAAIAVKRNELGLSQKELAKKCQMPYYKIRRLEECYDGTQIKDLLRVCVTLGLVLKVEANKND